MTIIPTAATNRAFASKLRNIFYVGTGTSIFVSAMYVSYHIQRMDKQFEERKKEMVSSSSSSGGGGACCNCYSFASNPNRNEQYKRVASCYDTAIGNDEFYMGINIIRYILMKYFAYGTILEVGAGTGRNIPYYHTPQIQRVVLVDNCMEMLQQAKDKVLSMQHKPSQQRHLPQYAFIQADSSHLDEIPNDAFDTVIDTFGLCSYNDPVAVLHQMIRKCKKASSSSSANTHGKQNRGGTIILLEHGRSKTWSMITQHLDKHVEQHAANWGCVWNRDIDELLSHVTITTSIENNTDLIHDNTTNSNQATEDSLTTQQQSINQGGKYKMEVLHLYKFHFGTTYVIVGRPVIVEH